MLIKLKIETVKATYKNLTLTLALEPLQFGSDCGTH